MPSGVILGPADSPIELVIEGRPRDIGGTDVRPHPLIGQFVPLPER
jgi:hypothetical protein